jgi:arylsulfatase A-like enzyme
MVVSLSASLILLMLNIFSPPEEKPNILFLIADDWSYPHAGIYGDPVVRTPTFDRLAEEGALFQHAYTAAPSCSASRAAILTGRYPHQLESGGNLWSEWPAQFPTYVKLLEEKGYFAGSTRKGWGPGDYQVSGLKHNPAGKSYDNFRNFLKDRPDDKPFVFWFGSSDPHRDYETNTGIRSGMKLDDVIVPEFLPDLNCVRNDILDYYFEIERFDRECGQLIRILEEMGELDNTIIVMTSDNGMPFPRAKANLYDYGTRLPLVMRWPSRIEPGTVIEDFVSFTDFAPTFLEAAGLEPENMAGRSLWPMLNGEEDDRSHVFTERERHANVRKGDLSYPMRSIRNHDYLYIYNPMPGRDPAGNTTVHRSVGQYGDVDNSITKFLIMEMKDRKSQEDYFGLSFGKRPEEELYDVRNDPYQLINLAKDPAYIEIKVQMREQLRQWMSATSDRRAEDPQTDYWDKLRYTPEYQHSDVDYQEDIAEYLIQPPFNSEGIPCRLSP